MFLHQRCDHLQQQAHQAQQLFAEGKAATLVDGYWALPYLQENAGELLGSIKMALVPNSGTPKGETNSLSGGGGIRQSDPCRTRKTPALSLP